MDRQASKAPDPHLDATAVPTVVNHPKDPYTRGMYATRPPFSPRKYPLRQALALGLLGSLSLILGGCGEGLFGKKFDRPQNDSAQYTVASGDTVYAIARRSGVPVRTIIDDNHLQPPYLLRVGQVLTLAPERTHVVGDGDTAYSLTKRYGISLSDLASRNNLGADYRIRTGQVLLIPDPSKGTTSRQASETVPAPVASVQTQSLPPPADQPTGSPGPPISLGDRPYASSAPQPSNVLPTVSAPAEAAPIAPPPARSGGFMWPVSGDILAGFGQIGGKIQNDGLNIASPQGTLVKASENGVVAYVGNEIRGYGNLVLIKHDNDFMTAYAHLEKITVSRGQQVRKGDPIATVGSTGGVARPQLHFEIRKGGKPVAPLPYLKGEKLATR